MLPSADTVGYYSTFKASGRTPWNGDQTIISTPASWSIVSAVILSDSSIGLYWRGVLISFEEKRQDSLDGGSDQFKASAIKIKMHDLVSNQFARPVLMIRQCIRVVEVLYE